MNSKKWFKYVECDTDNKQFTVTEAGGGSAAETAKLKGGATKLAVTCTNASAGKMKTLTIATPVDFDVLGATVYKESDNTLIGASMGKCSEWFRCPITDEMTPATGLYGLIKYSTNSSLYNSFSVDDDDLTITVSGSSASSLLIVLDIMLT